MNVETSIKDTLEQIFAKLQSNDKGLISSEAHVRNLKYGANVLTINHNSIYSIFFKQFKSSLVFLLIIASIISFIFNSVSDGITITVILVINTLLGFIQEYRSEKTAEKLSKLISNSVEVIRDNKEEVISQSEVSIGDVLIIKEGDIISADARIISSDDFAVDESPLTGESVQVFKYVDLDKDALDILKSHNYIFCGTTVTHGYAHAIVYAIGMNTQIGHIASITSSTKKESLYEKNISSFSKTLISITFGALLLLFLFEFFFRRSSMNLVEFMLFLIALAISVVPEALPVITTVTMSVGAAQLAKKKVIVKRLSALEDLGNVEILCTDKTGTLTENELKLVKYVSSDERKLFTYTLLAIEVPSLKRKKIIHSFDESILEYIDKKYSKDVINFEKVKYIPFDPKLRRRNIIVKNRDSNQVINIGMGAPESLIPISDLSDDNKIKLQNEINEIGNHGLRSIALGYKDDSFNFTNIKFLGYYIFEDPIKKSAFSSIATAKQLGIKIKILTGDSIEVAKYVAQSIGMISPNDKVYSSTQLKAMSPQEFSQAVSECDVFARIDPEQKYEIIKEIKKKYVVAYQGDGINDTPSLKLANVSIAVNTASDIAKENADVILLNNDLNVVVDGIKYGRKVFHNINKYIKHTMISNFGTFFFLCILEITSSNLPLLPIQLLLFSLLSDIPLLAISTDNTSPYELKLPESFNAKRLLALCFVLGIITTVFTLIFMLIANIQFSSTIQTGTFIFLNITALIVIFSIRNKRAFYVGIKPSRSLVLAVLGIIVLTLILPFSPIQSIFHFQNISILFLIEIVLFSGLYFIAIDSIKIRLEKFLDGFLN